MILVLGSVTTSADRLDELVAASLAHVQHSRAEDGCLDHRVHRDVERPERLVFVEHWRDRAALDAHFAQPTSHAFVAAANALATERPTIEIHQL